MILSILECCNGHGKYEFSLHHRYSDEVKGILTLDGLPEKGSSGYYKAMTYRDRFIHGRRLATTNDQTPLTFSHGNETNLYTSLGYLHYVNVSVGTPALSYFVALDTGSDLFWLPCDCTSCVNGLQYSNGDVWNFNIYSPSNSSTSKTVLCSSTLCDSTCASAGDKCPYQVNYLSDDTSTTGYLVQDNLHLITDDSKEEASSPQITLGCGVNETGSFLEGSAPNGLFGLGMDNISVPSVLAQKGLIANSFSMCFGSDGVGRISFGDKGSTDQGETTFYVSQKNPTYNITVTKIDVGGNVSSVQLNAIFDTGTSFTYLTDPVYSKFTSAYDSLANEQRYYPTTNDSIPFEYCYKLSTNQNSYVVPEVNLTMKGGDLYAVADPTIVTYLTDSNNKRFYIYCLAVTKSEDIDIIGQNFMTGYRIIFDRESNVLGWKASSCYDVDDSTKTPSENSPPPPPEADNPPPPPTSKIGDNTGASAATSLHGANPSKTLTMMLLVVLMTMLIFV
ncbi:hypothetical protein ACFE04_015776 [Oxalis oulophora]